jgi:hypothetical protein
MTEVHKIISLLDSLLNGTTRQAIAELPLNGLEKEFYTFYLSNTTLLSDQFHHSQISQDLWVAFFVELLE